MSLTMRTLSVLTAGFLLVVAMPVQAQDEALEPGIYNPTDDPTPTTMYFHINGFQDFPINTQKPDDSYAASSPLGLATHSACVEDPSDQTHFTDQSQHTYYGYSSPGYVQYDVDESGEPRYHPERGISFNVDLDESTQPVLTWYVESQVFAGNTDPDPNQIPVPIPNVIVRGTVREGDAISVGHSALNEGVPIAQGQTPPTMLNGQTTDGGEHVEYFTTEGGKHLYKFTVPLEYNRASIDAEESYNMRVDVFMENPRCDDPGADGGDYLMADFVRVHTSPKYRPNLEWSVMNPLRIEYLHPQFIADELVVHTSTNSPWGNYDVRGDLPSEQAGGIDIEITGGPSTAVTVDRVAMTARTHEHDHHTEAVDATWIWNYKADNAKEGEYKIVFKAKNDQEHPNSEAVAVAMFEIGTGRVTGCGDQAEGDSDGCNTEENLDGKTKTNEESPGLPAIALLGAIAAVGVALRRRS